MRRTFHDMSDDPPPGAAPGKPLTPAARRALEEAAARRVVEPPPDKTPKEIGGAEGPDPSRFGDWEHNGRAIDF
jgi:hypothetical protein